MRMCGVVALVSVLSACTGVDGTDSGFTEDELCAGAGENTVQIGVSAGNVFTPFEANQEVVLSPAPQGGSGVPVTIQTSGLLTESEVSVELITEFNGEETGTHLAEAEYLFCQDGGSGILRGTVVGFDPVRWPNLSDLLEFDDQVIDLVVTVTDSESESATVRLPVTIQVSQ